MEIGTLLFMLALAYGLGLLWYELLPGHVPPQVWRVTAYPFVFMALTEGFIAGQYFPSFGPAFGSIHVAEAVVATLVGVLLDWAIIALRHPVAVPMLESQAAPMRG